MYADSEFFPTREWYSMLYPLNISSGWTQDILNENLLNERRKGGTNISKIPAMCLVSGASPRLSYLILTTILWNRWDYHHFRGSERFRHMVKVRQQWVTELKFEPWSDSLQSLSAILCTLLSLCKNLKRSEGLIEIAQSRTGGKGH